MKLANVLKDLPLFFLLLYGFDLFAQPAYRINTNNGLTSNNLTVIIKGSNNYMWMGSFDGVQKHEGSRVKVYKNSAVDSLSLSSNEAHVVFEDRKGFIWVGTMAGIDRIDPKTNAIRHYNLKSRYFPNQGNGYPYSIFQDKKDSIWVTNDGGLFRINERTGGYNQVEERNTNGNGVYDSHTGYKGSFATETGIWLYTTGGMIFYEYRTGKFHSRYYNPEKKRIFDIEAGSKTGANGEMCHDRGGSLYFIARDSVLVKYNIRTEKIDTFPFTRPPHSWQCCYALACDYHNNIWIGFRHGGILLFNQAQSTFTPICFNGVNSLIGSNYIYSFAEDYLHRMWVTTDNGAYIIDRYTTGTEQYYLSEKKEFTDLEYTPGLLTEDDEGNLYMPFREGGLVVFNEATKTTTEYPVSKKNRLYSFFYPYYKNTSWIGCNGNLYPAIIAKDKLTIDTTHNLLPLLAATPKRQVVWMLQAKKVLFVKTSDSSIFEIRKGMPPRQLLSFSFMKQMCLSADSQYLYYINAQFDIVRHNIASQKEDTILITTLLQQQGFIYIDPRDIADDGRGNIWITSQNGLIRYNIGDRTVQTYTISQGLSNNFSFALCRDKNNDLWVATLGGISRYNIANNTFSTFYYFSSSTYQDGYGSGLLLKNGNVAFHIGNKLVIIDPERVQMQPKLQKQLRVNEISVNGVLADINKKMFSLTYNQNRLIVKFGLLDFENASKVKYYYNLNGSDSNWVSLGNQSELFLYSLSPGTYSLKVKAVDGLGNPVSDRIDLSFVIHPPFYKTTSFILLLVLLACYGGVRIYLLIRNKYKQQTILNFFVASLSTRISIDDMVCSITNNCVEKLGFNNSAVYILDDEKNVLVQRAACNVPNTKKFHTSIPLEISLGQGIIGKVCQSLSGEIINHTTKRNGDGISAVKRSELIVPVVADGHVFGAIYSRHYRRNFFTKEHLYLLKEVAEISAVRISKYFTEERLRGKIARDLHDDLGSVLSSINITSKMALEGGVQQTIMEDYLKKIKNNSGKMMESMSDIVWAIDPQNDTLEKVLIRMKEFTAEILEPLNINYLFIDEIDFEGAKLDLNKRKNFYLIFKEGINNAAKYSQCTTVRVHIRSNNNCIILAITDNGKGFDRLKIKKGNGLRNMQERAFTMGGAVTISSEKGGTTVQLKVPIT